VATALVSEVNQEVEGDSWEARLLNKM